MIKPLASTWKLQSFIYTFSGVASGAVGSYKSGIIIPKRAILFINCAKVVTTVTGGAGAKIQVGWLGFENILGEFALPFIDGKFLGFDPPIQATGLPILFTIVVNPVTDGSVKFIIPYIETSN